MYFRLLAISFILAVCQPAIGTAQSVTEADRYFEYEQFYKAAKLYHELLNVDSTYLYAGYQLAESYRMLFDYKTAEKYYKMVYEADTSMNHPLSLYYYALTQKYNEHFREAITSFNKYLAYSEKLKAAKITAYRYYDKQAIIEKNGCFFALTQLSRRSKNYHFAKLPVPLNSDYNDYAPAIYQHDSLIAIASGRIVAGSAIDNRFGESFGDIYQFEKKEEGWKKNEKDQDFGIINTKWAEGSGMFNTEKNKYYFTSCDKKETCHIYVTELIKNKWQEPVLLNKNINAPKSNAKQPSLTPKGDTLFFVSNREGGFGSSDIWMSISAGGDNWGPAINLGDNVNTPAHELAPFYHPESAILFFASNGHEGFGGLDIYMIKHPLKGGDVNNLGWPFNSSRDDFYFVFGDNTGYLSSNREDTDTKFDIFSFTKSERQNLLNYFDYGYYDETQPVIATQDQNGNHLVFNGLIEGNMTGTKTPVSDLLLSYSMAFASLRNGANRFVLSTHIEGDLYTEKKAKSPIPDDTYEYMPRQELLLASENDLIAQPLPGVVATINTFSVTDTANQAMLTGELYDAINHSPIVEEIVQLANDNGEVIKITTTDKTGSFKFSNLNALERYRIVLNETQSEDYPNYYVTNVKVISYGSDISTEKFENIYFDNNVYLLRNEAKLVLNDLVNFYRENPEIQIEINAYTDNNGSDVYNVELSRKRGRTAFDYLIDQGINRTAIVMNAKGKSTPIASNDNPAGKQLNRRVEFEIIGPDISYQASTTTLVVKSGMTLSALARKSGSTLEDLQLLNNFKATYIPAYTPVRVKRPVSHMDEKLFAGINIKADNNLLR